jgi:hypothetical protein
MLNQLPKLLFRLVVFLLRHPDPRQRPGYVPRLRCYLLRFLEDVLREIGLVVPRMGLRHLDVRRYELRPVVEDRAEFGHGARRLSPGEMYLPFHEVGVDALRTLFEDRFHVLACLIEPPPGKMNTGKHVLRLDHFRACVVLRGPERLFENLDGFV